MDDGQGKNWKKFQKVRFDKKQTIKRLRRAEAVSVRHAHKFILKRWRNVRDVRRTIAFWMAAVGCLILAVGLQLFWDKQSYETKTGALGGTYAEAVMGPVDTLNPLFADTPAEEAVGQLVFSRLFNYDKTGNLNYDAAKSLAISEDRLVYTVTLRDDIKWHDGRSLTVDDVEFTASLLRDRNTRAQMRGWENIEVVKKDDMTIEFRLKTVYAPFQSALTFPILPKHILGDVGHTELREHTYSSSPVGSGPFEFRLLQDTEVANKKVVHLAASDKYYGQKPKLARFQILASPDESTIEKALLTNEVNAAGGASRELISKLPNDRYAIQTKPVQAGVFALMNNDSEILSDKKVRKALQFATDTEEIRSKVGEDVGELHHPYTNFSEEDKKQAGLPKFDANEAAKLFDEAGWKLEGEVRKKDGRELQISVITVKNVDYERALETIIGQWRSVGVVVNERIVDASDITQNFVQSVLQPRAYDVLIYQLVIGGDPDVFDFWHSSRATALGRNLSNYSSDVADDILGSALSAKSRDLRNVKHIAFAKQWLADAPAIALYQSVTHTVVGRSVGGMLPGVTLVAPSARYQQALNWTVGSRTIYKTP